MKRVALGLALVSPWLARGALADPPPDADLGAPLPGAAAAPAMTGVGITAGIGVLEVPATHHMPGATFVGYSTSVYGSITAARPGWFGYYSLDFAQGFRIGGDATYFDIGLPAFGYGYRAQHWLAGVQLRPQIEHFPSDYEFSVAADAQLCLQYNFLGISPKNSAACAFVAPVVYRSGWMQGESAGVRFVLF